MLVFISRQKFLRLRLQLNLIKVKPALGEYGQRGWHWAGVEWRAAGVHDIATAKVTLL